MDPWLTANCYWPALDDGCAPLPSRRRGQRPLIINALARSLWSQSPRPSSSSANANAAAPAATNGAAARPSAAGPRLPLIFPWVRGGVNDGAERVEAAFCHCCSVQSAMLAVDCASDDDLQYGCQPSRFQSMWVWMCLQRAWVPHLHPRQAAKSPPKPSFDPSVFQLPGAWALRVLSRRKNWLALQAGCAHRPRAQPSQLHRYQDRIATLGIDISLCCKRRAMPRPRRRALLLFTCTLSSAHASEHRKTTEYRKTAVDAPTRRHVRPAARRGLGLARELAKDLASTSTASRARAPGGVAREWKEPKVVVGGTPGAAAEGAKLAKKEAVDPQQLQRQVGSGVSPRTTKALGTHQLWASSRRDDRCIPQLQCADDGHAAGHRGNMERP